jgi:hypothetical protein
MDDLVDHITHLQFTPEHARAALEFTSYDLHNALALLVNGKIVGPDGLVDEDSAPRRKSSRLERRDDDDEAPVKVPSRRTGEERKLHDELKAFSGEEKMAFMRLCGKQCDRNTVLQVVLACDKAELCAQMCLESMT